MQLERYIITTTGFEVGRWFDNNAYCILVELASHGKPTIGDFCEDYKVSPTTTERLLGDASRWVYVKENSPKLVMPTEDCAKILNLIGANQKW